MQITNECLGLPLETGLALLKARGVDTEGLIIEETSAPRGKLARGTLRIVRVQEGKLTVCRFPDSVNTEIG